MSNYFQAKSIILNDVDQNLKSLTENGTSKIESFFEKQSGDLESIARSPILSSGNENAIRSYLRDEINNNPIYETILWTDRNGTIHDINGSNGNIANIPQFEQALQGTTVIGDPDHSSATQKMIVPIFTPIKSGNTISGVLLGIVNIDAVEKVVFNIKAGNTGYAFVFRKDGLVLVHPDKEYANQVNLLNENMPKELKDAVTDAATGHSNSTKYQLNGTDKYLCYLPIKGTDWTLGVTMPAEEAIASLSSLKWISFITIILMLILVTLIIYYIVARLTGPLTKLEAAASSIASGDLKIPQLRISSNDEIGRLGKAFETMSTNLQKLIRQIATTAEQLSASSEELYASSEQSAQAANQIADSIETTTTGISQQGNSLTNSLALIKTIVTGSKEEADKTHKAAAISASAVTAATEGNYTVEKAIAQMNNIRNTVDNSAKVISELGLQSKEIGQIIATISGIAGQTNLLALNAAIEAARAGEQGKGFAVVAEEVRKLAEGSQAAAKQISELIGEIKQKTEEAVLAMNNGTQEVKLGTEVVDSARSAFTSINQHIQEVATISSQTEKTMTSQTLLSQEILEAMNDIHQVGQTISDQTQTISASTQEQSASMQEISASSRHLAELAEDLRTAVAHFKL